MAYFTEQELTKYAVEGRQQHFSNIKEASEQAAVTIFLSHSHKDKILVLGLISYLEKLGVKIYVDWNDKDMPRITNRETADRIKVKIKTHRLFMVLATKNAIDSKWVPWEVGVADQAKGESQIIVIPVADPSGRYDGAEYLQLYRVIRDSDNGKKAVFEPDLKKGYWVDDFVKVFGAKA